MPQLHVRDFGVDSHLDDHGELEYVFIHCFGSGPDGALGEEEGGQVPEGVWRQVQEEEVLHVAGGLVGV